MTKIVKANAEWAKIKAVYPDLGLQDLKSVRTIDLVNRPFVLRHLNATARESASSAKEFSRKLRKYVEPARTRRDPTSERIETEPPQVWPLIKCVNIYTKRRFLSTGIVLVDVPGTQDSDAARARIAQQYMMHCDHIFIFAPIKRAASSKAASDLIGEHLRRQLQFDGRQASVSFICSMIDDISVKETYRDLDIEELTRPVKDAIDSVKKKASTAEDMHLVAEAKVKHYKRQLQLAKKEKKTWTDLKTRIQKGDSNVLPPHRASKRKIGHKHELTTRKRARKVADQSQTSQNRYQLDVFESVNEPYEESQTSIPLTTGDVDAKLMKLDPLVETFSDKLNEAQLQLQTLTADINELKEEHRNLESEEKGLCIAARNGWSIGSIRQQFLSAMRAHDEEIAMDEDELSFDANVPRREYEEEGPKFPVICVSSRAFQNMKGRGDTAENLDGFLQLEDTGIPELKDHCTELARSNRLTSSSGFLASLNSFRSSLEPSTRNGEHAVILSHEQWAMARLAFENELDTFCDKIKQIDDETRESVRANLSRLQLSVAPEAENGAKRALGKMKDIGLPISRGGIPWQTYRAAVRRSGAYTNTTRTVDMNKDISGEWEELIVAQWNTCFNIRIPGVLNWDGRRKGIALDTFHAAVNKRVEALGIEKSAFAPLDRNTPYWQRTFQDKANALKQLISDEQKIVNRSFSDKVESGLDPTYKDAIKITGRGAHAKIKAKVEGGVERLAAGIFMGCGDDMSSALDAKLRLDMTRRMDADLHSSLEAISAVYKDVLKDAEDGTEETRLKELELRADLDEAINELDSSFLALINQFQIEDEEAMIEDEAATEQTDSDDEQEGSEFEDETDDDETTEDEDLGDVEIDVTNVTGEDVHAQMDIEEIQEVVGAGPLEADADIALQPLEKDLANGNGAEAETKVTNLEASELGGKADQLQPQPELAMVLADANTLAPTSSETASAEDASMQEDTSDKI